MKVQFSATCLGTVLYTDLPCTLPEVGQLAALQGVWSVAGARMLLVHSTGKVTEHWWKWRDA